jgi:hypothetical protein
MSPGHYNKKRLKGGSPMATDAKKRKTRAEKRLTSRALEMAHQSDFKAADKAFSKHKSNL